MNVAIPTTQQPYADIHHFDGSSLDEEGEIMLGFYFQIMKNKAAALSHLTGPYGSRQECETACQKEFSNGKY